MVQDSLDSSKIIIFKRLSKQYSIIKKVLVYRSFWGRGGNYKRLLHFSILLITFLIFVSGLTNRFASISNTSALAFSGEPVGILDLLVQGGSLQTVLIGDKNIRFKYFEHIVQDGESLESIALNYNVSKNTIKDSNTFLFGSYERYTNENLNPGEKLIIPEINGVVLEVREGDTLESLTAKASGVIEEVVGVNGLISANASLAGISKLLIPNGSLPSPAPPPPTVPYQNFYRNPTNQGVSIIAAGEIFGIPLGNPLSNPDCIGYVWSRGYLPWHPAVDLAKGGGCPIRAVASGVVTYSGWSNGGQGYNVRIDHGNGVETYYYHAETLWVRTGDYVVLGQEIMYMGCTGFCTGTHLHLELRVNGIPIDTAPYIPY